MEMTQASGTEVLFRPCRPEDVDEAVPLIHSSGPEAFDYVFCARRQGQAMDFLRAAFVEGRSEFGYQQNTALVRGGRVVGIGAVREASQNLSFMLAATRAIFRDYGPWGGCVTIARGLRCERVIQPPQKGVGLIYGVAIAPDLRGQGLGRQLMSRLIERVRHLNVPAAVLDVRVSNHRAKGLYRSLGFEEAGFRHGGFRSQFGYVEDHIHMRLDF